MYERKESSPLKRGGQRALLCCLRARGGSELQMRLWWKLVSGATGEIEKAVESPSVVSFGSWCICQCCPPPPPPPTPKSWFRTGPRSRRLVPREETKANVCCPQLQLHLSGKGLYYRPRAPNQAAVYAIRQLLPGIGQNIIRRGERGGGQFHQAHLQAAGGGGAELSLSKKSCIRLWPTMFILILLR